MGIKISKVRDSRTLKVITTKDCEHGYQGEYICFSTTCHAQMSFVPSHERRVHEKTIVISSFFKLQKNQLHNGLCPYNTVGAVKIIARDSDSNVLKALNNGKYEFNLQILHQPDKKKSNSLENGSLDVTKKNLNIKTKQYIKKGTASTYIKALTEILKLRAMLEESRELASVLLLSYQGHKIKWDDFYFEESEYFKASEVITQAKALYPVCFHGTISNLVSGTDKFPFNKIKLNSPFVKPVNKINDVPVVELILADEQFSLEAFSIGQEVLVYGKVKVTTGLWTSPKKEGAPTYNYINMVIWVSHKEQIVIL